jgi:hypothetical protein
MDYEIEFMPVGDASKAGDCILVRYGTPDSCKIMIIDGGNLDSGEALVNNVKSLCASDSIVEHVLCSHADADHASGLRPLLEQLKVKNLWLHVPWLHSAESREYFKDKRWTDSGLANELKNKFDIASELVDLALAGNVKIFEPWLGSEVGPFTVLNPTPYAYARLLPQFERTPDPDQEKLEAERWWLGKPTAIQRIVRAVLEKAKSWVEERWDRELLRDNGTTSASNESSTVLYSDFGQAPGVLSTADAGENALRWSADELEKRRIALRQFRLIQIPHHGSRSNVGPTILNRLVGPIVAQTPDNPPFAIVSAPKDDEVHPRRMVINAFIRRGTKVCSTQGISFVYRKGFPRRAGFSTAVPLDFSNKVEEYD